MAWQPGAKDKILIALQEMREALKHAQEIGRLFNKPPYPAYVQFQPGVDFGKMRLDVKDRLEEYLPLECRVLLGYSLDSLRDACGELACMINITGVPRPDVFRRQIYLAQEAVNRLYAKIKVV